MQSKNIIYIILGVFAALVLGWFLFFRSSVSAAVICETWCHTPSPTPKPTPSPTPCVLDVHVGEEWIKIPCPSPSPSAPVPSVVPGNNGGGSSGGNTLPPSCSLPVPLSPSNVSVNNFNEAAGTMVVQWVPTQNPGLPLAIVQYQVPNGPTYYTQPVANTGIVIVSFQPGLSDVFNVSVAQSNGCTVSPYTASVLVQTPQKQAVLNSLGAK